jgi:hypothetical protein
MDRIQQVIYAAGFFDGEGTVGTPHRRFLYVAASQVDPRPLQLLVELFGGAIYSHHQGPKFEAKRVKPAWRWNLTGASAAVALAEMLPYLIVKRDVAELGIALAALTSTVDGQWSREANPERRARQETLGDRIRRLNDFRGGKARRAPA